MSSATITGEISVPQTGPRFLIGGVMLAVMAAWAYVNHDPAPVGIVAVLGITAALATIVGIAGLRQKSADGIAARRTTGLVALTIGVVVAGCASWLAMQFKLEALGESAGLGVFAILAIAAGLQDRCAGLSAQDVWVKVLKMRALLGIALAALGVAGIGSFFYCTFVQKVGTDYAPELIGLMLSGFILFFAGFYLLASKDSSPEAGGLRTFFIIIGSLLGAIITLVSMGRAFLWNTEIFRSGISAWSGSEAWRFWLVAYLFLAGIGLAYASLNLSLSQTRADPFMRRTLFGYRNIIAGILLLILLAFANFFVALKAPFTFDWSKSRGMTAINAGSKNLLAGLSDPIGVYVLMSPNGPIFNDVRNFVGNCQAFTSKMSVTYIDPDNDPREFNKLAIRFKEIVSDVRNPFDDDAGRGVLLVNGPLPDDPAQAVPHVFIPEKRLFEVDRKGGKKDTLVLKAESEIMKELAFLVKKSEKRKIYFLQGDGALDMSVNDSNSRRSPSAELANLGAGKLVEKLKKDNYDILGLSFDIAPKDKSKDIVHLGSLKGDKKPEIPEDCDVLFVIGLSGPVSQAGLDAMERYMDHGGKMIVALDVITDAQFKKLRNSGLEDFVKKYGVTVTDQILYRLPQEGDQGIFPGRSVLDQRVVLALAPAKAATVLAKQFKGVPFRLWSSRVVKGGTSTKYQVEPLLTVNPPRPLVWADDNLAGLINWKPYVDDVIRTGKIETLLSKEPISVAVTVTESSGEAAKPRMVVIGDAEFLSNEDIEIYPSNYDLAVSAVEWMISERGFVGPRPKESSRYSFGPAVDLERMVYGAFWTMLVLIVMLGVGVWLARRK